MIIGYLDPWGWVHGAFGFGKCRESLAGMHAVSTSGCLLPNDSAAEFLVTFGVWMMDHP